MNLQSRDAAWGLLCEYTRSESLRKHAMAVEACMIAYADKFARDGGLSQPEAEALRQKYSLTGLLHDFDYEQFPTPEQHPFVGSKILEERGYPEEMRRAILAHADYTGVERETHMEKALFACDELAGFITAISYVKPNKSVFEVDAQSVKKKMKDKAFARSVNRGDIVEGARELGVELDEHIEFCVKAMQDRAKELGLEGTVAAGS
jgi:predicted hydrolase (HD superfamily)